MGKKLYCYYAKPTWTDGVPGIWAHFEDDRYRDGGVCLHIHIRDLIETWEPDEGDDRAARWVEHRDMVLEYAKRPGEEWLRNMMEKAKAERFAAKVCG